VDSRVRGNDRCAQGGLLQAGIRGEACSDLGISATTSRSPARRDVPVERLLRRPGGPFLRRSPPKPEGNRIHGQSKGRMRTQVSGDRCRVLGDRCRVSGVGCRGPGFREDTAGSADRGLLRSAAFSRKNHGPTNQVRATCLPQAKCRDPSRSLP
jgi:hypothetical protein